VSDKTGGLIKEIIEADSLDGLSRLVMVNAIYFKGKWRYPFDAKETETKPFHVDSGRQVSGTLTGTLT
jgi:serpin B